MLVDSSPRRINLTIKGNPRRIDVLINFCNRCIDVCVNICYVYIDYIRYLEICLTSLGSTILGLPYEMDVYVIVIIIPITITLLRSFSINSTIEFRLAEMNLLHNVILRNIDGTVVEWSKV